MGGGGLIFQDHIQPGFICFIKGTCRRNSYWPSIYWQPFKSSSDKKNKDILVFLSNRLYFVTFIQWHRRVNSQVISTYELTSSPFGSFNVDVVNEQIFRQK